MKSVLKMIAVVTMAAGLTVGPVAVAEAHPWRCQGNTPYHWASSGGEVAVATEFQNLQPKKPAKKAAKDLMAKAPFIKINTVASGGQMTIVDGNEGDKGWAGLAVVKPNAACEIVHADVILNTFYGTQGSLAQGIYCQEIGHSFGLDHSDDGSCMGLGYFRSGTSVISGHNVDDLKGIYQGGSAQAPSNKLLAQKRKAPPMLISAVWGFSPDSIGEAENEAETVVVAQAASSAPGTPITTEDGIVIPTTNTTLEVDTAYKGDALPGEEVVVQQIGGDGVFATEDPAYRPGQEYLLMLDPNDEGNVNHIVSPDARYSLRADGTLTATMETSVSASVSGQSLSALTGSLGLQPIRAGKAEFGGEGLTRILIIVGIAIAALVALALIARFALGRR
ncbi:MAG TPA: hypothetical protein VE174_14260 [Actinomycetota bacterium]|nr:hypothetical protein [Actinomycetota bacterium]